jgi:hypothetical protein
LVSREVLLEAEQAAYHSAGTCTFYGTANSNQMLMEIMGLHLPGSSFVNPGTALRQALTDGREVADLVVAALCRINAADDAGDDSDLAPSGSQQARQALLHAPCRGWLGGLSGACQDRALRMVIARPAITAEQATQFLCTLCFCTLCFSTLWVCFLQPIDQTGDIRK